jgi:hypothetical protein
MDAETRALWEDIRRGVVDINNQQLFFSIVAKGFIYKLNQRLKLRGKNIPHYILNTGDDIMYLEVKGQDHSIEPVEISNEDFVYSQVPRCMIQPTGINVQMDQLSNPYSHGKFEIEHNDMIYSFRAEFRRIPVTYGFSLKYYLDNFTDSLDVIQQIITNLSFVNLFKVLYLGQQINCSYQIPDSYQTEYMMEFDGITTESKYRTISLELEVTTNIPVIHEETIIPSNMIIREVLLGVHEPERGKTNSISGAGSIISTGTGSANGNNGGSGGSGDGSNNSGTSGDVNGGSGGNSGGNSGGGTDSGSGGVNSGSNSDIPELVFRHGLILHPKGGLYTSDGEISDK